MIMMNSRPVRVWAAWGALMVLTAAAAPASADWPQFLGPDRNGVGPEDQGLARQWPAGGPKVLWRVAVGEGFAGPAVYADSVLILDREDDARDVLRRLRLADGSEVWRLAYPAPGRLDRNGSRTTPATDGKRVFSVGPFGHIRAVNFDDGKELWRAHLLKDWEAARPGWGVSQSPLLMDRAVVFAPWGRKAAVVAYDKVNGHVLWTTPNHRSIRQDYSSVVPMKLGSRQVIVASGLHGYTIGVDAADGSELWSFSGYKCNIHIPSPTILDKRRVLLSGGYGAGSVIFRINGSAKRYGTHQLWKDRRVGAKIAQPVFYQGMIYGPSGDTRGNLRCGTPAGRTKWDTGNAPRFGQGSLIIVDGLMFILHGQTGELVMAEANPSRYRELGRARILKGPKVWSPLAYSDGKLVIRDQHELVCVDVRSPAS